MSKKKSAEALKPKIYEYDITEKEFDNYISNVKDVVCLYPDPDVQSAEECKNPEYKIYGRMMADDVKYKEYRTEVDGKEIEAHKISIQASEYIRCPHCAIKYSSLHQNDCPVCHRKTREIINTNRCFSDELENYRIELQSLYQKQMSEKYESKKDKLLKKYNLVFDD